MTSLLLDNPSARSRALGALARACLSAAQETHPKLGHLSPRGFGGDPAMEAALQRRSLSVLDCYCVALAEAGADGASFPRLWHIMRAARDAMPALCDGMPMHPPAVSALGLLCAAAGLRAARCAPQSLGQIVSQHWGEAMGALPAEDGPTVAEAMAGFPTAYAIGRPALRRGRVLSRGQEDAARIQVLMAVIAQMDEPDLQPECGADALAFACAEARGFLAAGGVGRPGWRAAAEAMHRSLIAHGFSPVGTADHLTVTLFLDAAEPL